MFVKFICQAVAKYCHNQSFLLLRKTKKTNSSFRIHHVSLWENSNHRIPTITCCAVAFDTSQQISVNQGPKTAYETYANNPELWMYLHSKTNVLVYFCSTLTQRWPRWAGAHLGTRIGVRIPWDAIVFEQDRCWANDRACHDLRWTAFKKMKRSFVDVELIEKSWYISNNFITSRICNFHVPKDLSKNQMQFPG